MGMRHYFVKWLNILRMADLRSSVSESQSGGRRLSLASEARQDAVAGSPNLVAVALRHFDLFAWCTFSAAVKTSKIMLTLMVCIQMSVCPPYTASSASVTGSLLVKICTWSFALIEENILFIFSV